MAVTKTILVNIGIESYQYLTEILIDNRVLYRCKGVLRRERRTTLHIKIIVYAATLNKKISWITSRPQRYRLFLCDGHCRKQFRFLFLIRNR